MLQKKKIGGGRRADRRRLFIDARVVHGDGSSSSSCVIRDLSPDGAKIELAASVSLPKHLFLLESTKWSAYEADLIWRRGDFAGLRFLRLHDLEHATDPKLIKLKYMSTSLGRG